MKEKLKLVILDGYTSNPGDISYDDFKKDFDFVCYDRTKKEEAEERIKDADIILTNKVALDRKALENTKAKYVGVLATGYDIVDIKSAEEFGIRVTNVPGYSTSSVVELTFAHILNIYNSVGEYAGAVREGAWVESEDFAFFLRPFSELENKVLGIIGYGSIGQRVKKVAEAFGMKTVVMQSEKHEVKKSDVTVLGRDEFFKEADIISLHAPLNDDSRGIIRKENIQRMKDGVIIINTARGALVNEDDLYEALVSGKVSAYGADTVAKEPMDSGNKLYKLKNVYYTPHIAWASKEARKRLLKTAYENIKAYLDGEEKNVIA